MDNTWIKFYRKSKDNGIMKDHLAWTLFSWILLSVDRKTGRYSTGRFQLAEALKAKPPTIQKALGRLSKKYKMVSTKSNNKFTEISVLNWAKYQLGEDEISAPVSTKYQQSITKQEVENKEDINIYGENAQKKKYTTADLEDISFKDPKNSIHTEWQEKAFRYATELGINLDTLDEKGRSIKPRWLKLFQDSQEGIRLGNLERATAYLIDYPNKIPSEEKIKLFFWVYANKEKMKGDYVTTD